MDIFIWLIDNYSTYKHAIVVSYFMYSDRIKLSSVAYSSV